MDEYEEAAGLGILSGDAIRAHDSARVRPNPNRLGIDIVAACPHCGRENTVTVEWSELVIVSLGVTPQGWQYDAEHGMWQPKLGCPSCRRQVNVGLTPDECGKHVRAGIAARSITQQQVQGLVAQVQPR